MNIIEQIVQTEKQLSDIKGKAREASEKVLTKAEASAVAMQVLCLSSVAAVEHGTHLRGRLIDAEMQESRASKVAATAHSIVEEFGDALDSEGYLAALMEEDCETQAAVFKRYKKIDPALEWAKARDKANTKYEALTEPEKTRGKTFLKGIVEKREVAKLNNAELEGKLQQQKEDNAAITREIRSQMVRV